MNAFRILVVTFACLLAFECAHAQGSKRMSKSRHHFSTPRVRGSKARIICPTFDKSQYPLHSLGFKLGDPFALTYKFYPNKRISFAADIGKAASGLYNRYFREKFNFYVMADTVASGESSVSYMAHHVKSDLIGEIKVLFHLDAKKISEGLQGYAGIGWEWKQTRLTYDYLYNPSNNAAPDDPFGSFDRNRATMGPEFVLGIEYAYFSIPVSAFMEVEYFMDVQADPGWQRFEGGVGLRYIF